MARGPSPAVRDAFVKLFEETFYSIMIAMVKADPVEDEYASMRATVRSLTEEQLRTISRLAGEYYVQRANPAPKNLTLEQTQRLKKRALEFALSRIQRQDNR